jgi:hypothetical protein
MYGEENNPRVAEEETRQVTVAEIFRKHVLRAQEVTEGGVGKGHFVNRNNLKFRYEGL